MIIHIWSYFSVLVAGVLLSVTTRHAWQHAKWLYFTYELIGVLIFLCELPFIFIINRVIDQAYISKKKAEVMRDDTSDHTDNSDNSVKKVDLRDDLELRQEIGSESKECDSDDEISDCNQTEVFESNH